MLCDKNAISPSYRVLHLDKELVRGCSAFGIMEISTSLDINKSCYIEAESFLQVLKSMPEADLEFVVKDNALHWKCGAANARLAIKAEEITIPELIIPDLKFTSLDTGFSKNLSLGSIACGTTALMSIGLYGITFDNSYNLEVYASDNATISGCIVNKQISVAPAQFYLSPAASRVLEVTSGIDQCEVAIDENKSVYCVAPSVKLLLKQSAPLKQDIKAMISRFDTEELTTPLNKDVIAAFIRRAEALADEKGKSIVSMSVENRTTKLIFEGNTASSQEYYLTEDAPDITVGPILIEGKRIAKALSHAKKLVFDYVNKKALVLRGDSNFMFVVSGK